MDLERTVGLHPDGSVWLPDRRTATGSILLKLAAMGIEIPPETAGDEDVFHLAGNLFARYREQARLLSEHGAGAVTTRGVVVGDFEAPSVPGQIRGFYIQDPGGDGDARTSDGIFVFGGSRACCRSTPAPLTAGSSITWTTCWRRPARPTPSASRPRRSSWTSTASPAS